MISRLIWSALALAAIAVGVAARWLTPSPTGMGTHRALGLPPCGFLGLTGMPCPTCGLTTAFSLLAHGELRASLRVHPLGVPLFMVLLVGLGVALVGALRAWPVAETVDRLRADRWALLLVCALLASWVARLI